MQNLLSNKTILATTIFFAIVGCRKDPHIVEEPPIVDDDCIEGCVELTPPGPPGAGEVIEDTYVAQGIQYLSPCFNPNNANEFVFVRIGASANPELVKYNLVTKQETVLLDPMTLARPQWGRQGWITFVYTDKHVARIYEDGTNLSQITSGVDDQNPTFNYSGDRIFYYRSKNYNNAELSANPDLYKEYKMMVIDIDGNVLDSVVAPNILPGNYFQKWDFAAANSDGQTYFVGGSGPSAGFYILDSDLDSVFPTPIQTLYPNVGWVGDLTYSNGFIYYTKWNNHLYKTEVATGIETVIKSGCDSRYYECISVSPDGSKILVDKVIRTRLDYYTVDVQHDFWLYDLNSCEATPILVGQ